MARRSWQWRGFGLSIAIPDRLVRRRRRRGPLGRLVVREPPPVVPDPRDARQAADFVREGIDHAERGIWYHTIELPDGATRGMYDHRELLSVYDVPEDLRGARVLDVGSYDGFWALEFERRGADVTAVDIATSSDLDLPPAAREFIEAKGWEFPIGERFAQARRATGSCIKMVNSTVYDLDPARLGTFDLVHAGDLLLHLRDPVLALQRIRSVTAGHALISDCFDPDLDPDAGHLMRYEGAWLWATWWMPSLSALVQMVADAGFGSVRLLKTYNLPPLDSDLGPWRALLRAQP